MHLKFNCQSHIFFTKTFVHICFIVFADKNCAILFEHILSGFGYMFMDTKKIFVSLIFKLVKLIFQEFRIILENCIFCSINMHLKDNICYIISIGTVLTMDLILFSNYTQKRTIRRSKFRFSIIMSMI